MVGINGRGDGWDSDVFRNDPPRRQDYTLDTLLQRSGGQGTALTLIDDEGNFAEIRPEQLATAPN